MKTIIINSKTYGRHEVYYNDEDHELVSKFIWCVVPNRNTFYAMTRIIQGIKKYKTLRMHQLFLTGKPIDHIDGNGLNNQRNNLRLCSDQQNNCNKGISIRNKSGFKGVHYCPGRKKKWCSNIRINGKLIVGGQFDTPLEAAIKYNELAIEYHGEFAWLNKVS